jgi:hypothetical protein
LIVSASRQSPSLGNSTSIWVPTGQARLPAGLAPPMPGPWQAQLQMPGWPGGSAPVQEPPVQNESAVQARSLFAPPWQRPSQP